MPMCAPRMAREGTEEPIATATGDHSPLGSRTRLASTDEATGGEEAQQLTTTSRACLEMET